jgi:signal peptidase I
MKNKPRKWLIACLLSFFGTGLGQVYNGQALKGLLFFMLLPLLLYIPFGIALFYCDTFSLWPLILIAPIALTILFYLAALIDSILTAQKLSNQYEPKWYNRLTIYVALCPLIYAGYGTIAALVRTHICQAFTVPLSSMKPTVFLGDYIIVDRRPSAHNPQRGDIIVFHYPLDLEKLFIKRVVAIGGDTVEIRDKVLLLNGERVKEAYVIHTDSHIISGSVRPRDNIGPLKVPVNAYFVLGDNRDESFDSRFWGFVEKSKVVGIVRTIYWSWDRNNMRVRWDRIGLQVNTFKSTAG